MPAQRLLLVTAPIIMTGVRTAAVLTVGAATLAGFSGRADREGRWSRALGKRAWYFPVRWRPRRWRWQCTVSRG